MICRLSKSLDIETNKTDNSTTNNLHENNEQKKILKKKNALEWDKLPTKKKISNSKNPTKNSIFLKLFF